MDEIITKFEYNKLVRTSKNHILGYTNPSGDTIINFCCKISKNDSHTEILNMIFAKLTMADITEIINKPDIAGNTPLINCVESNFTLVGLLLRSNADPNILTPDWNISPIKLAIKSKLLVTELLLDYADIHLQHRDGKSAVEYAVETLGLPSLNKILSITPAHKLPLISAIRYKNQQALDIILPRLINSAEVINQKDYLYISPLQYAVRAENINLVIQLLTFNADPNNIAYDGSTPLFDVARSHNNVRIFQLLVDAGADLYHINRGQTLLDATSNSEIQEIIKRNTSSYCAYM